jgi:hypothetical protein
LTDIGIDESWKVGLYLYSNPNIGTSMYSLYAYNGKRVWVKAKSEMAPIEEDILTIKRSHIIT